MKRFNQEGTGAVEVLVIVIVLVIIGATGYFIWHHNRHATDKNQKVTVTSTSNSPQQPTKNKNLYIKEWQLSMHYSGDPTLSYEFTDNAVVLQGDAPKSVNGLQCDAGTLVRGKSSDIAANFSSGGNQTFGDVLAHPPVGTKVTSFGGYVYLYTQPQGLCDSPSSPAGVQQSDDIKAAQSLLS